jgi:hypothetical protein
MNGIGRICQHSANPVSYVGRVKDVKSTRVRRLLQLR